MLTIGETIINLPTEIKKLKVWQFVFIIFSLKRKISFAMNALDYML
jgi:hypothetical protein